MVFAAARPAGFVDLVPHVLAIQVEPISMVVLGRGGLAVKLAKQDMSQRFGDMGRGLRQKIRDLHLYPAILQADVAVRVGKRLVFHGQGWNGGSGLDFTVDAAEHLFRGLEEKGAGKTGHDRGKHQRIGIKATPDSAGPSPRQGLARDK